MLSRPLTAAELTAQLDGLASEVELVKVRKRLAPDERAAWLATASDGQG